MTIPPAEPLTAPADIPSRSGSEPSLESGAPATGASPAPRRWKLWLLTCVVIYPVITGLGYVVAALGGALPLWAHFVIMVPIVVALLVFFAMPLLTRTFAAWLLR